jgi:acetoin utilization deacetylase AcuC-like enzyme
MLAAYSDRYVIDLPAHHTFPIQKYRLICERLLAEATLTPSDLIEAGLASDEDLLLVHTSDYVYRMQDGQLTERELRRLGLPWSPKLVQRSRSSVSGTVISARNAVDHGVAANLGGGTHHAYADHGEGYCVFNDIAVAIRVLRRERAIRKALIIDLDVHQGNGTAAIFAGDADTFTFSIHGAKNYPLRKETGNLDLALPDRTGDKEYLATLSEYLPGILKSFNPDIVFYQAGVDPFFDDRLGRLGLTHDGLRQRDEYVLWHCLHSGIPIVITIGGGYARNVDDTVEAHCNTIRAACQIFG